MTVLFGPKGEALAEVGERSKRDLIVQAGEGFQMLVRNPGEPLFETKDLRVFGGAVGVWLFMHEAIYKVVEKKAAEAIAELEQLKSVHAEVVRERDHLRRKYEKRGLTPVQ